MPGTCSAGVPEEDEGVQARTLPPLPFLLSSKEYGVQKHHFLFLIGGGYLYGLCVLERGPSAPDKDSRHTQHRSFGSLQKEFGGGPGNESWCLFSQTTAISFYPRDVSHRFLDSFSFGPVVAAQQSPISTYQT